MKDYSSSIFYKIKFNITAKDITADLLWAIVCHIKRWVTHKWNKAGKTVVTCEPKDWTKLKQGGSFVSQDKGVYIETTSFFEDGGMPYWACRISEKGVAKAEFAPREWITEIGIEPIEQGNVSFSYVVSYIDRPGFIGLCEDEPAPNIPNLIKSILKDPSFECKYGVDEVVLDPIPLNAETWDSFMERLFNQERDIPYIYISSKYDLTTNQYVCAVDPENIAIAAGGNAVVFYNTDTSALDYMDYFCPSEYRCYKGSMRIYMPRVNPDDVLDSRRHRYIGSNVIEELGEEKIIQMIRRAFAQDVHFYETFFRIQDCRKKYENYVRQQRLAELKKQHEEESQQIKVRSKQVTEDYLALAIQEEERRVEAETILAICEDELKKVKECNHNLSTEIESYRGLASKNAELERVCENRLATMKIPETPREVVCYFDAVFADRIAFSDDAQKTLKECHISLSDLWTSLFYLATVMYDLWSKGGSDIYSDFKSKTGIDVSRGEGPMTRKDKRLMRQFVTEYYGEEIDIEPHITFPRIKQSIHFGFSQKAQKIVVGSCGEHKEIYSTHKRK